VGVDALALMPDRVPIGADRAKLKLFLLVDGKMKHLNHAVFKK
jgi:hypothetical protein